MARWVAWGDNSYGQLGDGTTNSALTPIAVSGLTTATAIAGGWDHSLALKSNGTVWAWGANYYGQLGDGTTNSAFTPVAVSGLTNVLAISLACRIAWRTSSTARFGPGAITAMVNSATAQLTMRIHLLQ